MRVCTTVADLLDNPHLGLAVVAGGQGLDRHVVTSELNRPCLELTGYFEAFRAERIQVFGQGEITYMGVHDSDEKLRDYLERILNDEAPCAIVTNGREPPALLIELSDKAGIPTLTCQHSTTSLYKRLWEYLDEEFAPRTTMHGVLMDVHDMGVLLLGDSAVGKSECALELIRRGYHLVADDMVMMKCLNDSALFGRATEILPYHMEARGLGIIDISLLFGVAAIRPEKHITLAITLMDWDEALEYDRTGLESETMNILDVEIPHITIPVSPGRNVGTLVEVAALNQKLKNLGIDTAQNMDETLHKQLLPRTDGS